VSTVPVGTVIATDDVAVNGGSTAQVQYMKQVDGRANGTDGIPGDTQGLWTVRRDDVQVISVALAGATNVTYASGEQVGTIFTLANAARASGGTGEILNVIYVDYSDVMGAVDVVFFRQSVTLAADNAAFAISDADAAHFVDMVPCGPADMGNNRLMSARNVGLAYSCTGSTSLFAAIITRSANAGITPATNGLLVVTVRRN
jgi:hypothetical protein